MLNAMWSVRELGEDGAARDKVGKEGSSTVSSPNFRGGRDTPSLHKQTSSLGELNLKFVLNDRSDSLILISSSTRCFSIVFIILQILAKPSLGI